MDASSPEKQPLSGSASASPSGGRLIPAGLPQACPGCGKPFSLLANYSTRTSLMGRRLHALAILGGPIGCAVVVILNSIIANHEMADIGRSWPYGMMLGLLAPVIFFEGLALICKKVRTLRCHACGWEQDFPWPKRPRVVSSD